MKKLQMFLIILVAASLLLCSCTDELFTTGTYKQFSRFVKQHEGGVTKQEIFNRFGAPRSFTDESGEIQDFRYALTAEGEEELLKTYSSEWVYEFHKYGDPRDPYRVFITFDSDGKTTNVKMTAVGGG